MLSTKETLLAGLLAVSFGPSVLAQDPESVTGCHMHGSTPFCVAVETVTNEYELVGATPTGEMPAQFTGCHAHGSDLYCYADGTREEYEFLLEGGSSSGGEEEPADGGEATEGTNCHFHAGVEHCVGAGESEGGDQGPGSEYCERRDREYDIPLRIGLLFVILATSAIGVYAPILIDKFNLPMKHSVLLVVKQFGTGVILSTAFVHLYTHAQLMFGNSCLGELSYEATTSAIVMAGIFISFLIDYLTHRLVNWRKSKRSSDGESEAPSSHEANSQNKTISPHASAVLGGHGHPGWTMDPQTVASLEAGILFHSIIIGLTLVVAGDSVFLTLFAVILFHQMFEGLALGSMITQVPNSVLPLWKKLLMGLAFTLITPIGMAIGIGVLDHFNGNDPSTIIAIGTLDAFSAGILVWVGVVEMLAKDWMDGPLMHSGVVKTLAAGVSLVAGMIVMSVLGKWA